MYANIPQLHHFDLLHTIYKINKCNSILAITTFMKMKDNNNIITIKKMKQLRHTNSCARQHFFPLRLWHNDFGLFQLCFTSCTFWLVAAARQAREIYGKTNRWPVLLLRLLMAKLLRVYTRFLVFFLLFFWLFSWPVFHLWRVQNDLLCLYH